MHILTNAWKLEIITLFDNFIVQHIFNDENTVVNDLA
jgi:hypothetical protein